MMISPLLALTAAASLAASALPAPALEKIAEVPFVSGNNAFSPDFSLAAAAGETSVGVWRLEDGHQVARITLPRVSLIDKNDVARFWVDDISPDGKSLLLDLTHNRDWKQGEYGVYLVSLADEKIRPLLIGRNNCRHQLEEKPTDINPYICPGANASFSPDGRKVLINIESSPELIVRRGKPFLIDDEAVVVDLEGKVLRRIKETLRQDPPDANFNYPPLVSEAPNGARASRFRPDGALVGVLQDESSCELRDLDKDSRIGFLDGCDRRDKLAFDRSRAVLSASDAAVKRWDLLSGALLSNTACADCIVRFTENGDYAFVARKSPPYLFEIRGRPFATVLFSTNTNIDGAFGWDASPDGGLLIQKIAEGRSAVYRTGLAGKLPTPSQAAEALIDVDVVPNSKTELDPDAYAVVIGVEKYRQDGIPSVDFAAHDAQTVAAYLTGAMGYDPRNVVLLTNGQATRTDFEKNLKWLSNRVTAGSRVFVYFAGHGSPNPSNGQGYLMPYEADPAYLDETAFPIANLYASLGKLPTKDVTVVLDACFSGEGGRSLIAKGTRPLVSVVETKAGPNTTVLAAAGANQVSASYPAAHHGLLTYYLLAGLRGGADAKRDGLITTGELYAYVRPAVERAAKLQNVEQTPGLMSPADAPARPWVELAPRK
jgi:hypothetical protein